MQRYDNFSNEQIGFGVFLIFVCFFCVPLFFLRIERRSAEKKEYTLFICIGEIFGMGVERKMFVRVKKHRGGEN